MRQVGEGQLLLFAVGFARTGNIAEPLSSLPMVTDGANLSPSLVSFTSFLPLAIGIYTEKLDPQPQPACACGLVTWKDFATERFDKIDWPTRAPDQG